MVVTASDLVLYQPSFLPISANIVVGGGIGSPLTGFQGIVDEIFLTSASKSVGEGTNVRYSKFFIRNDDTSDSISDMRVWVLSQEKPNQVNMALEVSAGLAIYDGTQLVTNTSTAPIVTGFSNPTNHSDGLLFANSGIQGAGQAQGIWLRQTITEGLAADGSVPFTVAFGNVN